MPDPVHEILDWPCLRGQGYACTGWQIANAKTRFAKWLPGRAGSSIRSCDQRVTRMWETQWTEDASTSPKLGLDITPCRSLLIDRSDHATTHKSDCVKIFQNCQN